MITGGINYAKIDNPKCKDYSKMPIKTLNVDISLDIQQTPLLKINIGPEHISYTEFVKEGYLKFTKELSEIRNSTIEVKDVTVTPLYDNV